MPITKSTGTWNKLDKSYVIFVSNPVIYKSTAYYRNKVDLYFIETAMQKWHHLLQNTLTNYVLNKLQIFGCKSSAVCLMIVIFNSALMSIANFQGRCGAISQKTHLHTMALIFYRYWLQHFCFQG